MPLVFNSKLKEGVWCEYQPGVRVKIAPLDKPGFRAIRSAAMRKDLVIEKGRRIVEEKPDEELMDHLLFRRVIVDWEGIVDADNNPIPCTDEMKDVLTDTLLGFASWVLEEAMALAERRLEALDGAVKNS